MKKTNKIIPLDVRGTTKTATELTSQELEALQYMKKCGKLDMVNVQKQADMIKRNEYLSMNRGKSANRSLINSGEGIFLTNLSQTADDRSREQPEKELKMQSLITGKRNLITFIFQMHFRNGKIFRN